MADEVVQIVKVLDGLNRFRFAAEPNLLAAGTAACNVIGPPHPAEKTGCSGGARYRRSDQAGGMMMKSLLVRPEEVRSKK